MKIETTSLLDCVIITPKIHEDLRGYFYESFRQDVIEEALQKKITFVQDNQSRSEFGVIRGLHFQTGKHAQAKLVRVLEGTILDVAVDLRPNSLTYGQHISVELSENNHKQLFVPKGFAHGYAVLSPSATVLYKVDQYYSAAAEKGIVYNDSTLGIDWKLPVRAHTLSSKDLSLPKFNPSQ
jgi:dTDP-4-dehydrorhamnose 3,5-epimerase